MTVKEEVTAFLEERVDNDSKARPSEISASVGIRAEVGRILYALSTPEYMEAWLHLPGVERLECHSERRSFARFRIDMFSTNKKLTSIYGSCLLSKPNRVTYHLERDHAGIRSKSVVDISLRSGPECCTLALRHRGLTNEDEQAWQSTMWQLSLAKLSLVLERVKCEETRPAPG